MSVDTPNVSPDPSNLEGNLSDPSNHHQQHQAQRGGAGVQRGARGGQRGGQRGGRGGNRGGMNIVMGATESSSAHSNDQHQSRPHTGNRGGGTHHDRGGHRGGGAQRGGHRGGNRGGGRGGVAHQSIHTHPTQSNGGEISDADARAIDAALNEEHTVASAPSTARSSSSSSYSSLSSAELNRSILGFKYERTTHQQERFVNRPKTFPKGKPAEFDKQAYMQANHVFTLGEDDPASFLLPDHPLDWNKVELVVCPVEIEARECPICLAPPVAATITKCGHVYCRTCLLHYFSLSDRSWSRCPLCFDAVYPQALKSAEFRVHCKVSEGDTVEFRLMRRWKDSINAVPVDASTEEERDAFARIKLTTDISGIIQRELRELIQLRETSLRANDSFTLTYIDRAEALLLKRIEEFQTTHPHWHMSHPTFEELKEQERQRQLEQQEEQRRKKEKDSSILSKTEAWPDLAPSPTTNTAQLKMQRTNSTPSGTATASPMHSSVVSSPSLAPTLAPLPASSPGPSTSNSTSTSSTIPSGSIPPTSSAPKSSSFFDADEKAQEHRWNMRQAQAQAQQSQQSSSLSDSPSTSPQLQPSPIPKPGSAAGAASNLPHIPVQQNDTYFFYQASDGSQLYLHSLNFRSLLLTYSNDVALLPPRIRGKVIHKDSYLIDATIRSKFRFLSHLPLTASFALTLVDLGNVVSKDSLSSLAAEFAADKKQRQVAARKQRELNKRTIQSSKALAQSEGDASASSSNGGGRAKPGDGSSAFWQSVEPSDSSAFPDLANPLGLATAAAPLPASGSPPLNPSGSPAIRPQNWNIVGAKGLASAELWPSLDGGSSTQPSHAPVPAAKPASKAPGWGVKSAAPSSKPTAPIEPEESLPGDRRNLLFDLFQNASVKKGRK